MDTSIIISELEKKYYTSLPEFYSRRIIFWYDEDKEFEEQIADLHIDNVKIVIATGSNSFEIKKLLSIDDTNSNYLVYVPHEYSSSEDNWLLNIELFSGEVFRADLNSIWMDEMGLSTSPLFRNQIKQYHKFFNSKERRSKVAALSGKITSPSQLHLSVMSVCCGLKEVAPALIIRSVLMDGLDAESNAKYQALVSFGAQKTFWSLIEQACGYNGYETQDLLGCAEHILMTAASRTLGNDCLAGFESLISIPRQSFCYDLISEWLRSQDCSELYKIARKVEHELHLYQRFSKLTLDNLKDTECFPCVNEVILGRLMCDIRDDFTQNTVIDNIIEKRRSLAWFSALSDYFNGLQSYSAMYSFYLEHAAGFHIANAYDVWHAYTTDYYKMDLYYRHFQQAFQNSLKSSDMLLEDLFKSVAEKAESLYSTWFLANLGENWNNVASVELSEGYIDGLSRQTNFYANNVSNSDNRTYVIISDALRYDVAVSLAEELRRGTQGRVDIDSMMGTFPTITPLGMAALLPHKELTVINKNTGGFSVLADNMPTDSQSRDAVLKASNPDSVALQYKNIVGLKRSERSALVKGMDVVYIYHDKIDEAAHTSDDLVFAACDDAIEEIKNIIRIIVNDFGGTNILITADHGFLYTYSPLTEDDKLSANVGEGHLVDCGRRYCVFDADVSPQYLQPVKILDGKTGLYGYAPKENVRLKTGGSGLKFVHGGTSLQELVIPLISYHYLRNDYKEYQDNKDKIDTKPVEIALLSASRKICNLIFNLNFYQKDAVGDNREKAVYNLHFTDSEGKPVSDTVTIIADKTDTDVQMRSFRCTFNLKQMQFDSKEAYYLVIEDASNIQLPVREEFSIDIAFAVDEFNFN